VSVIDQLYEQQTEREQKRTSDERWGRGKTEVEQAAFDAALILRECGKCGARKTGSFVETGAWWADHCKRGCR
jgi:hypothetical protein